jgi:rhodanese-related sulfurtransferase
MNHILLFCSCLFLLSTTGLGASACGTTVCPNPAQGEQPTRVTGSELDALIAADEVIVINARPGATSGLPNSKSLHANPTEKETANVIPAKDSLVVTYCSSINCHWSGNLAKHLRSMGYTNVREYPAGIRGWKRAGRPTEQLL